MLRNGGSRDLEQLENFSHETGLIASKSKTKNRMLQFMLNHKIQTPVLYMLKVIICT